MSASPPSLESLPWDITRIIFRDLVPQEPQPYPPDLEGELNRRLTRLASVNRAWQAYFEPFNFESLGLTSDSLLQFQSYVNYDRVTFVKKIHLHVWLRHKNPLSYADVQENNTLFTRALDTLFRAMGYWPASLSRHLQLSVAVRTPLVNDKAFFIARKHPAWSEVSYINTVLHESSGRSDVAAALSNVRLTSELLPHVDGVTSFSTGPLWGNCSFEPRTLSRILGLIPFLREADIGMGKMLWNNTSADELIALRNTIWRWPRSMESLNIHHMLRVSNQLENVDNDSQETRELGFGLRQFASRTLRDLRVVNFLTVQSFMGNLWPGDECPVKIMAPPESLNGLDMKNQRLKTLYFETWTMSRDRILHYLRPENEEELALYCQCIMLSAARLATTMPQLNKMTIIQHLPRKKYFEVSYELSPLGPVLRWSGTEPFVLWRQTLQAWTRVAEKHTESPLRTSYGIDIHDVPVADAPLSLPYTVGINL
ncbi:hypothetical protein SODALDRAFT_320441 [Sodiomyces alkalinus F11]|uniref:DUF6546 domain-containing protein n=1 Tax=Sodiomyces alkalinus (strain CBS 110278 / VKM F-3762 / F11) TaxID=1314773 RepID=A0A3N2PN90_SODAK|nr:hypothetical protein SODALDRAFT_320441 [Sodiomyces alkalinus F11]ROT35972.1 hypothetical protein SODALDRAFT_320441 [Sodiomyces alkalinus F11]